MLAPKKAVKKATKKAPAKKPVAKKEAAPVKAKEITPGCALMYSDSFLQTQPTAAAPAMAKQRFKLIEASQDGKMYVLESQRYGRVTVCANDFQLAD